MASTYNSLGYQLMATGEQAGTWGTKTNTTLDEIKETFGYESIAMTADRTLLIPDGSTDANYDGRAFIIELTGTLGGTRVLDIALQAGDPAANIEKPFIVFDNTTHAGDTLTFKATGATGFALTEGQTYLCYHNGTDIINTGLGTGDVTLTGTQTLTNKTLTSPKIGTSILDTGGNELALLTATGSAVNELTIANSATGNGPIISTTGDDAAVDLNLNPKGVGVLKSGTAAIKIAGTETIWVPATAMYAATSNGCGDISQTELTAQYPEVKSLDFDPSSDEYAQFAVAFPKSWNEGTVTFQSFWSVSGTNAGTVQFAVQGVSVSSDDSLDVVMGTAVANTALAASGTTNDLMVNVESGAITIAGSPAAGDQVFFNIYRDVSGDTQSADVRLMGVKLFYTTDAANDV